MAEMRFPKEGDRLDHRELAGDPTVKPWLADAALKSENTAEVHLRRLGIFLWSTRLTTAKLVQLANEEPDDLRNLLIEYAGAAKKAEYLGTYVRRILVSVRSFLRFQGSAFDRFPSVQSTAGESLVNERIPTPDEVRLLLTAMTARGRTVVLLLAHAGLRPGVLGNMNGTDGLTLGDLPDLVLGADGPKIGKVPFSIVVPARLSKIRKAYLTFGTEELAETLLVYLQERLSKGEVLGPASPLIASIGQGKGSADRVGKLLKPAGRFVSEKSIAFDVRDAIRKVRPGGQVFRPYTLRAFCSTQLLLAESHGKIVRDAREHFLGHDLGAAGRYHLGKKLHPEVIEELRAMYERASEYLLTSAKTKNSGTRAVLRAMLTTLGYSESQVDRVDLTDEESVKTLLKADPEGRSAEPETNVPSPTPGSQKVVPNDAVEPYLNAGWQFVSALGADRAVLRA